MRVNVYSQELTGEVKLISKVSDGRVLTAIPCNLDGHVIGERERVPDWVREVWDEKAKPRGLFNPGFPESLNMAYTSMREEPVLYHAVQLFLHSSPRLHHPPMDDDRSAVTFWLPKSKTRREEMAKAFEQMAEHFRNAPDGSGLD